MYVRTNIHSPNNTEEARRGWGKRLAMKEQVWRFMKYHVNWRVRAGQREPIREV